MHCWRKIVVSAFLLLLFLCNSSEATKWYEYDNEDGTVGNNLPSSTSGPYYFELNYPGCNWCQDKSQVKDETAKYASDSIRGKFAKLRTWTPSNTTCDPVCTGSAACPMCGYYIQIWNPNGTYGTAFSEASPVKMVAGATYYLGGFFCYHRNFSQISQRDKIPGMEFIFVEFGSVVF